MQRIGRDEAMEIRDQYRHGMSVSAISRETGRDRKTIRHLVTATDLRTPETPSSRRPRLLAPYEEYIRQRTQEGGGNSSVLLDELRARGFTGSQTLLKNFLQPLRPARTVVPVVRYATPPGRQAQCDWAAFGETETATGEVQKLWAFVYTLSYSRSLSLEFVRNTAQDTWRLCLEQAFAAFGGVPLQVLSDNMSPMVLRHPPGGPVTWHPRFLDLARFHGFEPKAAEAYRAQTKGKVERPIRYIRGNFWPRLRAVADLDDLNRQAAHWVRTVADARFPQTLRCTPVSRRAADVAALTPWDPTRAFALSERRPRLVNREGSVQWAGYTWRVPPDYGGQTVEVQRTRDGGRRIFVGDTEVVRHPAPTSPHEVVIGTVPAIRQPAAGSPPLRSSRSGRRPLRGPEVERRPWAAYEAVMPE